MIVARKFTEPSSDDVIRNTIPRIQKVWPWPATMVASGE
jgi:hypothetical protein